MLLTLHNLAKTYKMLPSEALNRATTFDLYILDTFHRYSKYQELRQSGKAQPMAKPRREPTVDEMKAMIASVRANARPMRKRTNNVRSQS